MPRGKPFVCWLSTPGHYNDVKLCIGDEVMVSECGKPHVRGKICCRRGERFFPYYVKADGKRINVMSITQLQPVPEQVKP